GGGRSGRVGNVLALRGRQAMMARVLAVCRVVLGVLFIWAAVTKLPDMAAFAQGVANYRVIPAALVPIVAAAVVGIELLAGIALVIGGVARPAAAVPAVRPACFIAALANA